MTKPPGRTVGIGARLLVDVLEMEELGDMVEVDKNEEELDDAAVVTVIHEEVLAIVDVELKMVDVEVGFGGSPAHNALPSR